MTCLLLCLFGDWSASAMVEGPSTPFPTISFTGIKLTFTDIIYLDGAKNPLKISRIFDSVQFGFQASNYKAFDSQISNVDEPASLPLISLGVLAIFVRASYSRSRLACAVKRGDSDRNH